MLSGSFGFAFRIAKLDTDEYKDKKKINRKRARHQHQILIKFCSRWLFKPIVLPVTTKGRDGWHYIVNGGYDRLTCNLRVFSWLHLHYIDYADYMKRKGHIKKGSIWNK